ncbi:fimbrial assembly protein [Sulfuriferula plumbiphila]|uniref:Fimbrial assembly protein n=1 Tax=Sulfuriferula plumbiphila TaxID=171865 RepID=A0A512L839_9PROT|nr:pilus assembly protein PilM [Sulfuriferula plumbiphila]BBP05649.1 fimbrial assembly protein [Sulfuriferula plumbiphila]GEP30644.1 fimbrial assembly protein [Sulfuriferula plumbiphila]
MQFDFFKAKSPPLIGVDISTSAVKMVEVSDAGRGLFRIERYTIEPLPKEAVVDGNIAKLDEVADAIRRAWKDMGSRARHVALALPAAAVITKKIILPADLPELELESQVEAEANQSIPFALDEVNLDFQILGAAPNNPGEVEVLLAASRKEKVEDRVAAAEAAGLKVLVMDMESNASQTAYEAMTHMLPDDGRGQTVALIDIGAATMHIMVFVDGHMMYQREQSFGGNQLTQEIQRRYGMSAEEAEKAKRGGGLPESYEPEVLEPFTDTVALEISRALQLFFTSTPYSKVDHIVLAGGCAAIPGLDETVAGRTQASTMVANPFANMAVSNRVQPGRLALDAPALIVACGLAMRRFDPA